MDRRLECPASGARPVAFDLGSSPPEAAPAGAAGRTARPLRILVLTSECEGGGGQRASWQLAETLHAAGAEITVFSGRRRPHYPPWVHGVRLPIEDVLYQLDRRLGLDADLRHLGSIVRLAGATARQFDVVHLHNLRDSRGGWVSLRAVRRLARRLPTVWTFHDEWPVVPGMIADLQRMIPPHQVSEVLGADEPLYRDHPRTQVRQRWMRRVLPRPAAIVCPSRYMERLAIESGLYPGVPVHHVPNGLPFLARPETRQDRAAARRTLGLPHGEPVVLTIAPDLDTPLKGTRLGLATLARLRTPGVRFLAIGNASPRFRSQVPLPAAFTGYVHPDSARLALAYRAADVTLMPSVSENFPYVALESLACGTPVAGFRIGGLPEIVDPGGPPDGEPPGGPQGPGRHGRLAPPFDTQELATAVDALLADAGAREAAGRAGRRWVEETCDPQRWTRTHLAIYEAALADFYAAGTAGAPAPAVAHQPGRIGQGGSL